MLPLLMLCVAALAQTPAPSPRLRFVVTLSPKASQQPVSGRLLVMMSTKKPTRGFLSPGYGAETRDTWVAAKEVRDLKPGMSVDVDPDSLAFPAVFSSAPAGDYYVMALLDVDHNAAYSTATAGDIGHDPILMSKLNPADAGAVSLTLDSVVPQRKLTLPEHAEIVEFKSTVLSKFWGRPITMRAVVVPPPSYGKTDRRYPAVYVNHGYGAGMPALVNYSANHYANQMAEGKLPEMIYVVLDQHVPGGTHEFADSVNNGPWGEALTKEFIPYLESKYRIDARPKVRFLTGHSSGGWASAWLQVRYPKYFGGAWATSPDPVDFRNFTGPDIASERPQNLYRKPDGTPWMLVRVGGKDSESIEDFAKQEAVMGEYGGQMASFEWVFSPRGEDGRPAQLFSRATGEVDPEVAKHWQQYDISRIVRTRWKQIGPDLKGKLHIIVGTQDTFHLEGAVRLLDAEMKALGAEATFEYLEGRDHFNLYDGGLEERIAREMQQTADAHKAKATANAR